MWPRLETDFMEIGNSGWVSVGEGWYLNKVNGHTIDECGVEYDPTGKVVYDPNEKDD
jgi:hypothetical protein